MHFRTVGRQQLITCMDLGTGTKQQAKVSLTHLVRRQMALLQNSSHALLLVAPRRSVRKQELGRQCWRMDGNATCGREVGGRRTSRRALHRGTQEVLR
jgi:hypothetical protein